MDKNIKEIIPQYVPVNHKIKLSDCVDDTKTRELIKNIELANISPVEKKLLTMAAQRHLVFNYKNIADFYACASKETQKLMEDSALVIIDVNDAIKNGFAKLSKDINKLMEE